MKQEYYTIGEVSRICNVSAKALRYYDKIKLISPDYINEETGYRYYSEKSLLKVPVLKYYKQMGFKLEEMQELIDGNNYQFVLQNFHSKIDELKAQELEIRNNYISIKGWYKLIQEAQTVVKNRVEEVSIKYLDNARYCYMDQKFDYDYIKSIINIDWVNYMDSNQIKVVGPVLLEFPSYLDKMNGRSTKTKIMQKTIYQYEYDCSYTLFGNLIVASIYHIGSLESISEKYQKLLQWADDNGYICGPKAFERFVVDYWTTRNPEEFVTELLIPIKRKDCPKG